MRILNSRVSFLFLLSIILAFTFFVTFTNLADTANACRVRTYVKNPNYVPGETVKCQADPAQTSTFRCDGTDSSKQCNFEPSSWPYDWWAAWTVGDYTECGSGFYGDTIGRSDQSTVIPPSSYNGKTCIIKWGGLCDNSITGSWDSSERGCANCDSSTHKQTRIDFSAGCVGDNPKCSGSTYQVFESACGADPRCDEKNIGDVCDTASGIRSTCNSIGQCIKTPSCSSNNDCTLNYVCDLPYGKCVSCSSYSVETYSSDNKPDRLCESAGASGYCSAAKECDERVAGATFCIDKSNVAFCGSTCYYVSGPCPSNQFCSSISGKATCSPLQIGLVSPTKATYLVAKTFSVPVAAYTSVTSCDFYWNGVKMGSMNVPPNSNQQVVYATFTYTPILTGTFPAHAFCRDSAGDYGPGTDVKVTIQSSTSNWGGGGCFFICGRLLPDISSEDLNDAIKIFSDLSFPLFYQITQLLSVTTVI